MNVLELFGSLSLNTEGYEKSLSDAQKKGSAFASSLKTGLSTAAKVGATAIAAVGTAVTAVATSMVKATSEVAQYGDNIDKMSQKIGISAEAYQEWDAILQHSGASVDSLQSVMKTLSTAVETDSDALAQLGLTEDKLAGMNTEQIFSEVITQLQGMEEGTERTYLATKLLGRGATEMGALLNTSAEDTEAMRRRVHELNGVMSDEAVKAAAAYQDSLQDMQTAFNGAKRNITSSFMPAMTTMMDGLTSIFAGDSGGISIIGEGVKMMMGQVAEVMPMIMELATQIISSLMDALTQNLPMLISIATDMVFTLGQGLIQNLPQLLAAGMLMLNGLISGLMENLPLIIDAVLQIVLALGDAFVQYMPDIIAAGMVVLSGILDGIVTALPDMIPVIIDMLLMLVDVLTQNIPILIDAIVQIVAVLMQHLPEILNGLWQVVVKVWTSWLAPALNAVGQFLAMVWNSIVQVFSGVGSWFNNNVVQPIVSFFTDMWNNLKQGASNAWDGIKNVFSVVTTWFKDTFKKAWEGVKNVFSTGGKIFTGIKEGIENTFKTVVNGIIRGINTVVAIPFNAINSFLRTLRNVQILGWYPFSWISEFGVPQIPLLAQGGVLKRGQIGVLEGSGAEAVVPLEKNKEWIHAVAEDFGREMGSGTVITMNIYGAQGQDINELAEVISRKINDAVARDRRVFA